MILQISHIDKDFFKQSVLSDVTFFVDDREKVALVGGNGAGKSTLLDMIVGKIPADSGQITMAKDKTFGYLAQTATTDSGQTVCDEVKSAKPEILALEKKIEELTEKISHAGSDGGGDDDATLSLNRQLSAAQERFEALDGYAFPSQVTGVLNGLGFEQKDFSFPVSALSGGEKTRIALAKLLLSRPDFLILDEPTNHLDLASVHWLEEFLSRYPGAVLVVSHDRYFLDKIADKVVELKGTKATVYTGNYTSYIKKRQEAMQNALRQYQKNQAEIKHQEEVIAKLKQFNREKSVRRAESRQKQLEKTEKLEKPTDYDKQMQLNFSSGVRSGDDVLAVKNLSKSFDGRLLFSLVNFSCRRGEHIALIGENGTGKTTILKILTEQIPADTGSFTLGANVQLGYYDQDQKILDRTKTVFSQIQDTYTEMTNTQVRNVLAGFLFTGDDVFKPVEALSGGERARLSLALLMLSDANFLLLDEPTNHLDMDGKAVLETAVKNFFGTVLFVSHDRYFVNACAHRILDLSRQTVVSYPGNYDYYLEHKDSLGALSYAKPENGNKSLTNAKKSQPPQPAQADTTPKKSEAKLAREEQKRKQAQLRKRENELKAAEDEIARLEKENAALEKEMGKKEIATDSVKLQEIANKKAENDSALTELLARWEELMLPASH